MKTKKNLSLLLILIIALSLSSCQNFESNNKTLEKSNSRKETRDWPNGKITLICPWDIGDLSDLVNLEISHFGSNFSRYEILTDNIVGDGGTIALNQYLNEPANSNKLILADEGHFSIAPLVKEQGYRYEDFVPVINLYSSTFVLVANLSTNVTSFNSLKDYAKHHEVKIATSGKFSSEALQAVALFHEMGVKAKIIPYESSVEALKSALSGEVAFAVTHSALAKEYVEKLKINPVIAFDNHKLIDEVYNLDCVKDYGYNTWMTNSCAIFMRAGTDKKTVEKAYNKFKSILESREFLLNAADLNIKIDIKNGDEINKYFEECKTKAEKYVHLLSN